MTRKERRELKKDKSLVCSLYNIIDKYLPKLFVMFEELSDQRMQGKIKEISFTILTELISTHINLVESKNFQLRFDILII